MSNFDVPPPDYTLVADEPITATEDSVIISQPIVEDQSRPPRLTPPSPLPPGSVHAADTGPVVLSWNPAQSYVGPSAFLTRTTDRTPSEGSTSRLSPSRPPSPTPEGPRGYVETRVPTEPVVYTFLPFGHNCMILVPPPESHDTRPQYHITVDADCLNPLVHVTTVRRGANEYGDLVAEFEMGISNSPATLSIRGKHYKLSEVLLKTGSPTPHSWAWQFIRYKLHWDSKLTECKCYESPRKTTLYATFRPVRRPEARTHPVIQAQLELKPAGYHLFDDILVSALIMARCRAMPQDNNDLFNSQR
ncbi:hypothetical protein CCMSSC00406_0003485 [Pleurotus cornucopiae]|uniref:Uncharacterized protein n=1 Tax=Pleurotus cornucopiae TaxID=5321 RepID=A0ACB7J8E2_PLECO|nr:hypothetical protein CCMSSC00406_0003485 [Pleurotus cornucopiae]